MGLDNVAVQWPRTGRFYEPVAPTEFDDFGRFAAQTPVTGAAELADQIAGTGTVRATDYTALIDLLLGLEGVLYATEAGGEDEEDPVIDPDGCAWIAGGLERFVSGHAPYGEEIGFDTVAGVLRAAVEGTRLGDQQLRWLDTRLGTLREASGGTPQWNFTRTELDVLARFYRRCADRGFAVYADY
jgi:hypothetical protein